MGSVLLTNILVSLVKEHIDNQQYGVNIINLPRFNYYEFLKGIDNSLDKKIEVFFLGFHEEEKLEILEDINQINNIKTSFSVEEAEKSRNSGDETVFRIMIIKRREIEKLSSLLWFPEIDLNAVYKKSCKYVEKQLSNNSNVTINSLLKALARQDIRAILNLERLLNYLETLLASDNITLPSTIKSNLYRLGLCNDSNLDHGNPNVDELKKRIKINREIVNRIGALEQTERKSIIQYAADNPNNIIVKNILEYYKTKDIEVLKKLELSLVEKCLKEVKNGKETRKEIDTINPTCLAVQLAFDGSKEEIERILYQLDKEINEREDIDKPANISINANGFKVTIRTEPITEKIVNDFIDVRNYGGIIYADVSDLKNAIEALSKYEFFPFDDSYLEIAKEYLKNFDSYLRQVRGSEGFEAKKGVLYYLDYFLKLREELYPEAIRLQDTPMLQVIYQKIKYVAYLNAYADLLSGLREIFTEMWKLDPSASKYIISTIISLDFVYIIGKDNCHAIPTPLNPLYLWKFIKLSEEIVDSKSVDDILDVETSLSEEDKKFIVRKAEDIPDPLSVILLPKIVRDEGSIFLPLSGRIGCIPIYSSIQQVNQVESGIDSLRQAIVKYLFLYPHARLMLKICLINPPSVELVVDMLKKLSKEKEFNIEGINLIIYRTKESSRDWVEINDKSINEGFLSRVKSENSGRFNISIVNKVYQYDKILREIKRKQHLIIIFDPNEKRIDNAKLNPLIHLHPLCIPKVFECSPLSAEITIRPANEGGVFSDYINIIEKLNERPSSYSSTGLFYNTPIKEETFKELLNKTDWLVILDQNLKAWEISLSSISKRIYYKTHDYREIGIYSLCNKKFEKGFSKIISDMGNYIPQDKGIQNIINIIRSINDEGLLSIISYTTNNIFDERHGKGLIGLAIAAIEYKSNNPSSFLVGLDTQLAREWLADRDKAKLPDLIGITLEENNNATIDIIEVKTHQGDYTIKNGIVFGKAVDQILVIENLINEMMGENEKITTTARKEILRSQVFESLLQKDANAAFKHEYSEKFNELFAGKYKINVRRHIVYVAFDESESSKEDFITEDNTGNKVVQVNTIGSKIIQEIVAGNPIKTPDVKTEKNGVGLQILNVSKKEEAEIVYVGLEEDKIKAQKLNNILVPSKENEQSVNKEEGIKDEGYSKKAEKCAKLTKILRDFNIQVSPVDPNLVQQTSRFMRFKIELKSGETIQRLEKYKSDLSRELEAYGEILIENVKGTRYVSIDVPFRNEGKPIMLTDYLPFLSKRKGELISIVGLTPDGEIEYIDIAKAPHILIAGTTGSGKTLFLYSIIVSLIYKYDENEIELLIIDPKQTDFVFFNNLPHLRHNKVLIDSKQALSALNDIISNDIDERTNILIDGKSRDISSYNEKNPNNKMKRLVVIIDEYADLVQVAEVLGIRKDFEGKICRLAQRVRNLGIHLIIATQRPNAAIVTPALKANIPFRISFRLPSHQDSMTILDKSGAEDLLGKGDMLMVTDDDTKRIQGFFITEDALIEFIEKYPETKKKDERYIDTSFT